MSISTRSALAARTDAHHDLEGAHRLRPGGRSCKSPAGGAPGTRVRVEWSMAPDDPRRLATRLWQEAYRHQMAGDLARAIALYRRSISVHPTAEAHTFLGWSLSFLGRLEDATRECLRAIEIDPDFGNPYNDIGVYMMQQGRLDEAIPWLEKAKRASRYEPRQFPYVNLGRLHLRRGRWWEALREFEGAVAVAPDDVHARVMLEATRARLN